MTTLASNQFPENFLFGAATAAYQIEGAAFEDGRRASIWDAFSRVPGAVIGNHNGDVACDHYHRYRDDVALMKEIGLETYRFSTSWARVRPDGRDVNHAGVDFYSRLVDELLEADILPWLTLYHWDMPQALQETGGWTNRDTVGKFLDYAGTMLAAHHLLLAHGETVRELRGRDEALNLGLTLNYTVADAADPQNPADVDAARRVDGQFNRWFLDPIYRGEYPADIVEDIRAVELEAVARFEAAIHDSDLETISQPIDTQGVNYYHGDFLAGETPAHPPVSGAPTTARPTRSPYPSHEGIHSVERGLDRTAQNWEVQPEGLTRVLQRVWSEWAWGYDKRFGIVRVDYETQERSLKDSGREYARIIQARSL